MDHYHGHVRRRRGQHIAHRRAAFHQIDLPADQPRGARQLVFQIGAVHHHQDFHVVQITAGAQHPSDEHHGQRFARALRVPDHPAALHRRFARAQPLHDTAGGAVLLIAGEHFYPFAAVGILEHSASAKNIEQAMRVEQALHQFLLLTHHAKRRRDRCILFRPNIAPAIEMFGRGADTAELRCLAAGADHHQIGIKQLRLAFAQASPRGFGAGVAIALQLHKRFVHRVGGVGITDLGLDHHQRYAVHE